MIYLRELEAHCYLNRMGPVSCGPFGNSKGRDSMMCVYFWRRHQPWALVQKAAGCSHVGGYIERDEALHEDAFGSVFILQRSAQVVEVSLLEQSRGKGSSFRKT